MKTDLAMSRRAMKPRLPTPVEPDLNLKVVDPLAPQLAAKKLGAWETINPVDAAIASAESANHRAVACLVDRSLARRRGSRLLLHTAGEESGARLYAAPVMPGQTGLAATIQKSLNAHKDLLQTTEVVEVSVCLAGPPLCATGQLLVMRKETPKEMQLHQQTREVSQRSFHSAI